MPLGSNLYRINDDGSRDLYGEKNGRAGFYVDEGFTKYWVDDDGIINAAPGVRTVFYEFGQNGRPDLGYVGNEIRDRAGSDFSKDLFERYWLGRGDAVMSKERFLKIWDEIYKVDHNAFSKQGRKVTMEDGSVVYARTVNFYGSEVYSLALGRATVFFDVNNLPVGFYDFYDFDPKDWGIRSNDAEIKTRMVNTAGVLYGATPFKLVYGVVPSKYLR